MQTVLHQPRCNLHAQVLSVRANQLNPVAHSSTSEKPWPGLVALEPLWAWNLRELEALSVTALRTALCYHGIMEVRGLARRPAAGDTHTVGAALLLAITEFR